MKCRKLLAVECVARGGEWPAEDFTKRADRPFTGLCKKCRTAQTKAYYKANPEKRGVVRRRVNKRSYDANRPARLAAKAAYGKKNPEKRKGWRKYRLELRGVLQGHTRAQWRALKARYGRRCLKCGTTKDITRDHVKPLIDGGDDTIGNIQPLCRSCNASKGRKTVDYRT